MYPAKAERKRIRTERRKRKQERDAVRQKKQDKHSELCQEEPVPVVQPEQMPDQIFEETPNGKKHERQKELNGKELEKQESNSVVKQQKVRRSIQRKSPAGNKHGNQKDLTDEEWIELEEAVRVLAASENLSLKHPARWMFPTFFDERKRRSRIWKRLARAVPAKTASQVRVACQNHYLMPYLNTGAWTVEENSQLLCLIEEHGEKWALIARELNRLPARVRSHWISMQKTASGPWSIQEEADLIEAIETVQKHQHEEHDTRYCLDGIYWEGVAELVGTRSAQQCMQKWYHSSSFHPSIALPEKWSRRDDQHLLRALFCSRATSEDKIKWSALVPGRTIKQIKQRWAELRGENSNEQNLQSEVCRALERELPALYAKLRSSM